MDDQQKDNPYGVGPGVNPNNTTKPPSRPPLSLAIACAIGLWASLGGIAIAFITFLGTIDVHYVSGRLQVDGNPIPGVIAGVATFLLIVFYILFRLRPRG